MMEDKVMEVQ